MIRLNPFVSPLVLRSLAALAVLVAPSVASAQDPVVPVKEPNVLLVVDSSGSMEYRSGTDVFPTCSPVVGSSQKSRWVELVEVLAGNIVNYTCEAVDRSSASFGTDYSVGGQNPPDKNYRNPYNKPYSNGCAYMPNSAWFARSNAYEWDDPLAKTSAGAACAPSFSPFDGTGLLNSYGDLVRFGLMTFDTLPNEKTGVSGSYSPNFADGVVGAWSYYVGSPATGRPVDCTSDQSMEVGVRNGAAPPWEGRLIPFGDPDADLTTNRARHTRIGQVLMSTRPYGATPIAGALQDARDFLWNDSMADPLDPTNAAKSFGPFKDLYVQGKCREQAIVLLTDGEPNLDMRPACAQTNPTDSTKNGRCPFLLPEEVAGKMANGDSGSGTKKGVKTYVIGFAKTTSDANYPTTPINCETMAATEWTDTVNGACAKYPNDRALQTCCNLHRIADKGATTRAEFASNKLSLASKLNAVVKAITGGGKSSATQPVSAGIGQFDVSSPDASRKTVGFKLLTSFESTSPLDSQSKGNVWKGYFERARWACESNVPKLQAKNENYGDDFGKNLANNPGERYFVSFLAEDVAGTRYSERTLRPFLTASVVDGAGTLKGTQIQQKGSAFVGQVNDKAMRFGSDVFDNKGTATTVDDGPCVGLSSTACRDRILTWILGYDNGTGFHRCPNSTDCSLLGDIMHSTPVVVDRPSTSVPDESYSTFAGTTAMKERPLMAYASSNDGFLHGFLISANSSADKPASPTTPNEWFAFIPPMTLSQLWTQYPGSRQKILDGVATVRDVVATDDSTFSDYPYKLERTASAVQGSTSKWRTILLQAFGGGNSGYFAIDITDPHVTASSSAPKFLWQLTTDEAGQPLFGTNPGKPLITTLNINSKEVAVAILPGGNGGSPTSGTCSRHHSGSYAEIATGYDPVGLSVRCYGASSTAARSLTVVRLDSGEIIKTFRYDDVEVTANLRSRVIESELDAPITGNPAAYPYLIGSVSDRVFVGDQDGTLWKADFSNPNPDNWTMKLFFDAYVKYSGTGIEQKRRPISNPPVLSVDVRGQVTVAISTGDQDLSGGSGDRNYVWSITESLNSTSNGFIAVPNWYQEYTDGKHVLGPMQLTGEVLYYATIAKSTESAAAACGLASSEVWGVHYINAFQDPPGTVQVGKGGAAALKPTTTVGPSVVSGTYQFLTATDMNLDAGTIIFGVSVEIPPQCIDSSSVTDPYFGGTRTKSDIKNSSAPALTFNTGSATTSQNSLNFATNFETVGLQAPVPTSKNESWGAILD